jgi:hypothetical protein
MNGHFASVDKSFSFLQRNNDELKRHSGLRSEWLLTFCTAAATETKDLDQRLTQIKSGRQLPGESVEIDEFPFDVLHRFTAGADQVMMRFAIAVHSQGRSMRSHLPQQSTIDEKSQVVVDRRKRN